MPKRPRAIWPIEKNFHTLTHTKNFYVPICSKFLILYLFFLFAASDTPRVTVGPHNPLNVFKGSDTELVSFDFKIYRFI